MQEDEGRKSVRKLHVRSSLNCPAHWVTKTRALPMTWNSPRWNDLVAGWAEEDWHGDLLWAIEKSSEDVH